MSRVACLSVVTMLTASAVTPLILPARSADVAFKAPQAVPAWNWTGAYFGVHGGAGWSDTHWDSANRGLTTPLPFGGRAIAGGTIVGGQIGYNWQIGRVVLGAELSGSAADITGEVNCFTAFFLCSAKTDWLGTATLRAGWAVGPLLYYAKGGLARAHDSLHLQATAFVNQFDGSGVRNGWTAGVGVAYAFTPSWSAFAEYNYLGFGSDTVTVTDQFNNSSDISLRHDIQLVRLGLNYKLGSSEAGPFAAEPLGALAQAPLLSADWTIEAGTRIWYSQGRVKKDLYDNITPGQLNSTLTYGPEHGGSVEGFFRFQHADGLFVKGFLGLGALGKGSDLIDEDYPPALNPYSATASQMHDGRFRYGALDAGYILFQGARGKAGPFVGYRSFYQQSNGYGCVQIGSSPICGNAIPNQFLVLSETETWRGVAVGVNAQFNVFDRWKVSIDAAYLPYADRSGFDNHWFRPDINPLIESGHGWGTQVEAILSYAVTDRLSLGIGGRYWYFKTSEAEVRFPSSTTTSPLNFENYRYGGFLQASYKFGGSPTSGIALASEPWTVSWAGLYAGLQFGGAFGTEDWNSSTGILGLSTFPGSGSVDGLLAGGRIGYNYQFGRWVVGAEAEASFANLFGTAKCATFSTTDAGTCYTRIDSLGSLAGRFGTTAGNAFYYGKAGVAWSRNSQTIMFNNEDFTGEKTRWGALFGGGIEYAVAPNWSLNAEYNYMRFGDDDVILADSWQGPPAEVNISQRLHVFKLGVNYRFDWSRR